MTTAPHGLRSTDGGERRTRNVILVTVDGARWQEIFAGVEARRAEAHGMLSCNQLDADELMPNLHGRLIAGGVALGAPGRGAPVISSGPNFVSLPGYLEIATGRVGSGCASNLCGAVREPTLLDELHVGAGLDVGEVAVISSWERIERAAAHDLRGITISAGRHAGPTRDRLRVSPMASRLLDEAAGSRPGPGLFDYRPDRYTGELALQYLTARRPRFLWVGLGDTDEHAHHGDYPSYLEALQYVDRFLGKLASTLDGMEGYGADTTVFVTADHGRSNEFSGHGRGAPESSRVWLVAWGGAIDGRGAISRSRVTRLADVAPTVRQLLGLPADPSAGAGTPISELLPLPPEERRRLAARAPAQ